jgi:hypothetical protein
MSLIGPKPTNFVAFGWSGIEGSPDIASAILRPPLVTHFGHRWGLQAPASFGTRVGKEPLWSLGKTRLTEPLGERG